MGDSSITLTMPDGACVTGDIAFKITAAHVGNGTSVCFRPVTTLPDVHVNLLMRVGSTSGSYWTLGMVEKTDYYTGPRLHYRQTFDAAWLDEFRNAQGQLELVNYNNYMYDMTAQRKKDLCNHITNCALKPGNGAWELQDRTF